MRCQGYVRTLALVAVDGMTVAVSWAVALFLYDILGFGHYEYSFYLRMWPVIVGFVSVNAVFRLYQGGLLQPAAPLPPVEELRRLVGSSFFVHAMTVAVIAVARQTTLDYSRAVMIIACLLTAALAQPMRDVVRLLLWKGGVGLIPVHLLGDGRAVETLRARLAADFYTGFRVVEGKSADILVTCIDPRMLRCRIGELLRQYVHIEYVPLEGGYPVSGGHLISIDGMGGIEMVNQRQMKLLKCEKWLLDKSLALVMFALLLPFLLVVAALVKLTSRGPVFYRQRRLGLGGREIRVWKFRSMHVDADARLERILQTDPKAAEEWRSSHKLMRDPRVTAFGRFLRMTSIDEFPQFLNVIAGSMALVGPRPIVKDEVAFYGKAYEVMSSVKPGITGLWQVSGRSGTGYERRVSLDTRYVMNWSPWLDIWILMRTFTAVLTMRGAC